MRTLQRWRSNAAGSCIGADRRPDAVRPVPAHALTQAERQEILRVANEPRFADMPPARIVPMLAAGVPLYCQRVKLCPGAACAWTKPPPRADDNAFVESLFKTVKYRPEFPVQGMQSLAHARQWAAEFAHWYNHVHRHSGIQYVTPHQRHTDQDIEILRKRRQVYEQARQTMPARWSRHTRNWHHIDHVALNPERISVTDQKIPFAA